MNTPSFQEDHISQLPALQLLQNLGYTYLRLQEVNPRAELGERLRFGFDSGSSCSVLQDIRRFPVAFEICQTVSGKSLATGICQPVASKSEGTPILSPVARESDERFRVNIRRRRRDTPMLRSRPVCAAESQFTP